MRRPESCSGLAWTVAWCASTSGTLGTGIPDASARVGVFREDSGEPPSIMVVLRPPGRQSSVPQRLTAVSYLRPVARIKHVGTFGQIYHGEAAERAGYDDALLTGPGDVISESTISNIGFFDGNAVIWPSGPSLEGITMQLVSTALAERGIPSRRETVRVAALSLGPDLTSGLARSWHRGSRRR